MAYVVFSSGSTGTPKDATVSHQAALGTCTDVCDLGIGAQDAVLGLTSLSFDLSVFDVFRVLGVGGRLVLPRPGSQRDPEHRLELVAAHGVTVWTRPPATALRHGGPTDRPTRCASSRCTRCRRTWCRAGSA
ncbi:AMP-binding protein [Amycolatopsis sp. FDAARGOS 1241]|nr:AMP-binding protein [Amycolatopsis sp. FDAARGOS 1241]